MALGRTNHGAFAASTAPSSSQASDSFTIPNGELGIVIAEVVNDFDNESPDLSIVDDVSGVWTPISATLNSGGTGAYEDAIRGWWTIGTGAPRVITISSAGATHIRQWVMHRLSYSGFNAASPIGLVGANNALATDGPDSVSLGGTSAADSEIVSVVIGTIDSGGTTTFTQGAGQTELYDNSVSNWYATQLQIKAPGTPMTGAPWIDTNDAGVSYLRPLLAQAFEVKAASGPATEQEGHRFFNDDGSESGSTGAAAQDANATIAAGSIIRLRTLLNHSGDVPANGYKLQHRKVGDTPWKDVK